MSGVLIVTGASRGIGAAAAAIWLLSPAASYLHGTTIDVSGGR